MGVGGGGFKRSDSYGYDEGRGAHSPQPPPLSGPDRGDPTSPSPQTLQGGVVTGLGAELESTRRLLETARFKENNMREELESSRSDLARTRTELAGVREELQSSRSESDALRRKLEGEVEEIRLQLSRDRLDASERVRGAEQRAKVELEVIKRQHLEELDSLRRQSRSEVAALEVQLEGARSLS